MARHAPCIPVHNQVSEHAPIARLMVAYSKEIKLVTCWHKMALGSLEAKVVWLITHLRLHQEGLMIRAVMSSGTMYQS